MAMLAKVEEVLQRWALTSGKTLCTNLANLSIIISIIPLSRIA
jgi:hypothetical protein